MAGAEFVRADLHVHTFRDGDREPSPDLDEMGHIDPALALRVYRQAMRRGDGEKVALKALVEGLQPGRHHV